MSTDSSYLTVPMTSLTTPFTDTDEQQNRKFLVTRWSMVFCIT